MDQKRMDSPSLIEGLNALNVFGTARPEDFVFLSSEKRSNEEKAKRERREIEEKRREQQRKLEEDEMEFQRYTSEKNKTRHRDQNIYVPPHKVVMGRGAALLEDPKVKGRGRLSQTELNSVDFFHRAQNVHNNLDQFCDPDLQANVNQKLFWSERKLAVRDEGDSDLDYFDDDNDDDDNDNNNDKEKMVPSGSSSVTDQFEDAGSSTHTPSPSFHTASPSPDMLGRSRVASPLGTNAPRPAQQRRPRGSRLAARFDNSFDLEPEINDPPEAPVNSQKEEEVEKGQNDRFALLTSARSSISRTKGPSSSGSSFNGLSAAHRVLSNDWISYGFNGVNNSFTLNANDFPPL